MRTIRFLGKVRAATAVGLMFLLSACATTNTSGPDESSAASADLFLVSVNAQRAYQESRWLDAVRFYQQIVEQVPTDAAAWFRLANTYAQQGVFESAIHAYQQSLTFNAEQPKAWFNLSTAYLLHAQSAMQRSTGLLSQEDPARVLINARLDTLGNLVNGRL